MNPIFLGGAAVGVALMYFLDPTRAGVAARGRATRWCTPRAW